MKSILVIILLVGAISFVRAEGEVRLMCYSPTNSFAIYTEGDFVHAKIVMPYGSRMTQLSGGPITAIELPYFKTRAKNIAGLSTNLHFRWPVEKCTSNNSGLFDCRHGEMVESINDSVKFPAIKNILVKRKMLKSEYEKMNIQFIFQMNGESHIIGGSFALSSCIQ